MSQDAQAFINITCKSFAASSIVLYCLGVCVTLKLYAPLSAARLYDKCSISPSHQCIELTSYSVHGSVVERIGVQALQELAGEQYLSCNTQEGSFHVSGCWKGVEEFRSAVRRVLTNLASQNTAGAGDQMPQDSLSSLISQVSQGRETHRLRLSEGASPRMALAATERTVPQQTTSPGPIATPVVTTVTSPSTKPKVQTTESLVTTEQAPRPSTTSASSSAHRPTAPQSTEGRHEGSSVATAVTSAAKQPLKAKHPDLPASTRSKGGVKDDSVTQERWMEFSRPREGVRSLPLGTADRADSAFPTTATLNLTSGKPKGASVDDLVARFADLPASHPSVRSTSGSGTLNIGRRIGTRDNILGYTDAAVEPVMDDIGDLDHSTLQLMKKLGKCQMTGITLNCDIGSVTLSAATEEGLESMRNAFLMEYSEINPPKGKEIQYNVLDDTDMLQSYAAEADQKYKQCAFWMDKRARVIHIASRSETELDAAYKQLISQVIAHQVERAAFFGQHYDSELPATTVSSGRTPSVLTSSTVATTAAPPALFTMVGLTPVPPAATTLTASAPDQGLSIFEAAQIPGIGTQVKPTPQGVVQPQVDASKLKLSDASPTSVDHSPRRPATGPIDRLSRDSITRSVSQGDSMMVGDKKVLLQLNKGNIAQEEVDVIVNAANSNLRHLGGVARDLNEASEGVLQVLSDDYVQAKGAVPTGEVAVTAAGGHLKCKYVFHAVGPKASEHSRADCEKLLKDVCCKALQAAEKLSIATIAFPAISSGIFGVGVEIISRMLVKTLSEYSYSPETSLREVRIVILHDDILEPFQTYFRRKKRHLSNKGRGVSPGRPAIRPDGANNTSSKPNKVDGRKMADLAERSSRDLYLQSGGSTGRPEQRKKTPTTHEQKWRY